MFAKNGWTLVELLIVIAIVGILAAVVFNGYTHWGRTCREYCLSQGATVWTMGDSGCSCGGTTSK